MNWGSIKIALNSTLGTASFLPLDKMIENAKTYLSNKIDNNQTNIMSGIDNIITSTTGVGRVVCRQTVSVNENWYGAYISKFIAPVNGLYKIHVLATIGSTSGTKYQALYKMDCDKFTYSDSENNLITFNGENRFFSSSLGGQGTSSEFFINNTTTLITESVEYQDKNTDAIIEGYFYAKAGEPILIMIGDTRWTHGYVNSGIDIARATTTITCGNS